MKLPLEWLREYVDFDGSAEELAERLTFSGTEVEGIETVGNEYPGVIACEVLSVEPHPNAGRLRVCGVSDGRSSFSVICGAPNVAAGQKAVFAPAGTTLPRGMAIERKPIRGVESDGMLCAEDELGISDDHTGIIVLPSDVAPGTPFVNVIGPPEAVLTVEITWNRPDCLSMIGMAREVAALYGMRVRLPAFELRGAGPSVEDLASVQIDDPAGCPRYTAHVLTDAGSGRSPLWMQRRLQLCGVRPISVIVDITNYVMLETGQPLHAFDHSLLTDGRIIVRRAVPGEKMATLDDIERELSEEVLVIADPKGAVAVAGIMGGAGSEIRDDTKTVLLESACFDPSRVHTGSRELNLVTESSHRFARGVDLGSVKWAAQRAAALMVDLAGAIPARGTIDALPGTIEKRNVCCRYERVSAVLGTEVTPSTIREILQSLEFEITADDAEGCTVCVPSFRRDVTIEADLIEEVARLNGLDKIPEAVPAARIAPDADDSATRRDLACRSALVGLGLTEITNYSFVGGALLDRFDASPAAVGRRVVLPNPVSAEHAILRDALIPQMVQTLGTNTAHQNADLRLFEMGRLFRKAPDGAIVEEERLAIGLLGRVGRGPLDRVRPVTEEEMFRWVKGVVTELFAAVRVRNNALAPRAAPAMAPGWSMEVTVDGAAVGVMGLLDPAVSREWRIGEPLGVVELSREPLLSRVFDVPQAGQISAFPSVSRDLALIAGEDVTHQDILSVVREAAPPELTDVGLFDIFHGEGIGDGRRSLAYRFVYRSMERSLTDEDVNEYQDKIRSSLEQHLSVEIRKDSGNSR